jgi:2-dehydropantoate 2-reductase
VVQEMGRLTETPTPALDTVLALVVQRAEIAGLRGVSPPAQVNSPANSPANLSANSPAFA